MSGWFTSIMSTKDTKHIDTTSSNEVPKKEDDSPVIVHSNDEQPKEKLNQDNVNLAKGLHECIATGAISQPTLSNLNTNEVEKIKELAKEIKSFEDDANETKTTVKQPEENSDTIPPPLVQEMLNKFKDMLVEERLNDSPRPLSQKEKDDNKLHETVLTKFFMTGKVTDDLLDMLTANKTDAGVKNFFKVAREIKESVENPPMKVENPLVIEMMNRWHANWVKQLLNVKPRNPRTSDEKRKMEIIDKEILVYFTTGKFTCDAVDRLTIAEVSNIEDIFATAKEIKESVENKDKKVEPKFDLATIDNPVIAKMMEESDILLLAQLENENKNYTVDNFDEEKRIFDQELLKFFTTGVLVPKSVVLLRSRGYDINKFYDGAKTIKLDVENKKKEDDKLYFADKLIDSKNLTCLGGVDGFKVVFAIEYGKKVYENLPKDSEAYKSCIEIEKELEQNLKESKREPLCYDSRYGDALIELSKKKIDGLSKNEDMFHTPREKLIEYLNKVIKYGEEINENLISSGKMRDEANKMKNNLEEKKVKPSGFCKRLFKISLFLFIACGYIWFCSRGVNRILSRSVVGSEHPFMFLSRHPMLHSLMGFIDDLGVLSLLSYVCLMVPLTKIMWAEAS
jgi:hypothetical protein